MRRYLSLLWIQLRPAIQLGMQYRWDFIVDGVMGIVFAALTLLPLWVMGSLGRPVPGWTLPEMVVLVGIFTILKAFIEGAVNPALLVVVDHIRQGTLDFILVKPADAQFLVSTARFDPWRLIDAVTGLVICGWGFALLGRWPRPGHVLATLLLLATACLVLYSVWIIVISAAFWVVKIDNLAYLFMAIYDFGRWPVTIFKGPARLLFTFVVPIALMTTYPSMALLGTLRLRTGILAALGALAFAAAARRVWLAAIARYTSASS